MSNQRVIRGRGRLAEAFARSEKTASRWRRDGILKVETKPTGRPADWYVAVAEIERLKKKLEG